MKKTIYAAFIFAAFGMTACGEEQSSSAEETTSSEEVEEVETHNYALNASETSLEWRAAWIMPNEEGEVIQEAKNHTGTISLTEGELSKTGDDVSGSFIIDLTSIVVTDLEEEDGKGALEAHLMGTDEEKPVDDFFNTNDFAKGTVDINSIENGMADITINVIGIELNEVVELEVSETDNQMKMHGEFDVDMSALGFAMTETNTEEGNINPTVGFKLHLVLDKE